MDYIELHSISIECKKGLKVTMQYYQKCVALKNFKHKAQAISRKYLSAGFPLVHFAGKTSLSMVHLLGWDQAFLVS